jgi:chromosome segregation ATPase
MPKAPPAGPPPLKGESAAQDASKLTYGIEDVIQLMRDLPDSKKEMVILIVQKTLVSAKIDIRNILEKAARKIDNLQGKNDKLRAEIRELEELIIQKKSDVDRLRRDIEETQQVRQSFEQVYLRGTRSSVGASGEESASTPAGLNLDQVSG